ncbi:hypothetical protein ACH36K_11410 [Clostridium sp. MB05]|uniref:hypothetical protein n=1 Tax=Clostridium sp. MB05 TaxID=3376682 RepID=UPI003981AE29
MPSDPRFIPFPEDEERKLFRSLQYVRSEIDICDIRINSRHVVHYSGMHLESVLRLFLSKTKMCGNLRFFNSTLGKAAHEVNKMNVFDKSFIEVLFKFITLYNKAKHEVNMINNRARLFSVADAIICYFAARIIGQVILIKLQYPLSLNTYDINNDIYHN